MILTFFILALATTSSMISFLLLGLSSFYDGATTRNIQGINFGKIAVMIPSKVMFVPYEILTYYDWKPHDSSWCDFIVPTRKLSWGVGGEGLPQITANRKQYKPFEPKIPSLQPHCWIGTILFVSLCEKASSLLKDICFSFYLLNNYFYLISFL